MKRNQKFIAFIIALIILNLLGIGGWIYAFSYLNHSKSEAMEIYKQLAVTEKRIKDIKLFEDLLTSLSDEKKKIDSVFLDQQDFIRIIEDLEKLASTTDTIVELEGINFSTPSDQDNQLQLQLKVTGSFKDVFHYLVLLEHLPYQASFEKAQIQKQTGKSKWDAHFNIKILHYVTS